MGNLCLRKGKYDEKKLFGDCCQGRTVNEMWKEYGEELRKKGIAGCDDDDTPANPVPTHPAKSA